MPKYDIVSIGDTTIDAFIELHEASVNCKVDHTDCQLCMSYADKIPYEKLTILPAGNSTNNAVGSSRLGMKPAFITGIGDDLQGQSIIDKLKKEKVDTRYIQVNKGRQTNFHFVLNFKGERTILIKHNKLDYKLPKSLDTKWIYFSSMAQGTEKFHKQFAQFLNRHPKIKLSFNPGTFQMRMGTTKLKEIYKHTEILALNREEAQLVLKQQTRNVKILLKGMHKLGAKIAVITDGRDGSYASDANKVWYMMEYPGPKIEATGAGDSFGTAFTSAIYYGKSVPEAMAWGTINGGNVVLHIGPHEGLQTKKQIESYLRKNKKFRAKEI
ncbi:MAG: carbohydrate kinase family protein [Candidatus Doudnabacteria bacterium]|nr:carbohydrate kinase family protein [Candidatus Doudnabacteria bacterium]